MLKLVLVKDIVDHDVDMSMTVRAYFTVGEPPRMCNKVLETLENSTI